MPQKKVVYFKRGVTAPSCFDCDDACELRYNFRSDFHVRKPVNLLAVVADVFHFKYKSGIHYQGEQRASVVVKERIYKAFREISAGGFANGAQLYPCE
jgi:hypothetical protein